MLQILSKLAGDYLVLDTLSSHEFIPTFGLRTEYDDLRLQGFEVGEKHVIKEYMIFCVSFWVEQANDIMKDEQIPTEDYPRPQRQNSIILVGLLVMVVAVASLAVYQQAETRLTPIITSEEYNTIQQYLPIHAGEMHFSRVPREYWQHRILMIKALGLNTIGVYVFWNHHELDKGRFDFRNGDRDLVGFLELVKKHGLRVILRPGPYVCAEWDFGGLPARLLGIPELKIRSSNKIYEAEVFLYLSALAQAIKPFLSSNGGHIILLQLQNQLGSLNKDYKHTYNLKAMWEGLGIVCNFYYEDAWTNWMKHYWNGSNIGLSQGHHLNQYEDLMGSQYFKSRLVFGGEVYTGWLTHWGEEWQGLPTYDFRNNVQALLDRNYSFSLYVVHGGTNFGLTAGANQNKDGIYQAHVTSYDYGAVITEQGRPHDKFKELSQMMSQYLNKTLPAMPEPIPTIAISEIYLNLKAHLLDNLTPPQQIGNYSYFQSQQIRMYNQGIVIYQTILAVKKKYDLKMVVHDIAYVFIDGELVKMLRRSARVNHTFSVNCKQNQCVLRVLVEAMGHVNAGPYQQSQRKGLIYFEDRDDPTKNYYWKIYRIHLNDTSIHNWTKTDQKVSGPTLLRGIFKINELGDTFFQTSQFDKGYLWVNDHLLGRFWKLGPQQKLYCPGVWLKKGINQVHVLELGDSTARLISSVAR